MKKKLSLSLVVTILLVAMTLTFTVTIMAARQMFNSQMADVTEKEQMYDKIAELDKVVRNNFYTDINEQTLMDMVSTGYIAGLSDRNSRYYTAAQLTVRKDEDAGRLMGVGIDLAKDASGYFKIIKVYSGSPAQEAGIAKNNMLTKINGTDLTGQTVDAVTSMLNGEAGTTVSLTYLVDSNEVTVDLQRRTYDSPTVEYQMVGANGYIKIRTFAEGTLTELDQAINQLAAQGAQALVFDVRDNAGGLLQYAAECADLICPEGTLASGVYQNGTTEVLYTSDTNEVNLPCVVVTNGSTAAGAELFAVSVRDFEKGRIVGAKTAGKGVVQELFTLKDGSGVELTVATLLPGKSESFNGTGITPDYERILTAEEELAYYDFTTETDPQLLVAFDTASTLARSAGTSAQQQADSTPAEDAEVQSAANSAVADTAADSTAQTDSTVQTDSTAQADSAQLSTESAAPESAASSAAASTVEG